MPVKPAAVIAIPEAHWERIGDLEPTSRLLGTVVVNGVPFHLEAIEVNQDGKTHHWDGRETLAGLYEIDPEGPFTPVEIGGKNYVVVAYPFK